jgi:hypothetical protein
MNDTTKWVGMDTETFNGKPVLMCIAPEDTNPFCNTRFGKMAYAQLGNRLYDYLESLLNFQDYNIAVFNLSYDVEALLAMLPRKQRELFAIHKTVIIQVSIPGAKWGKRNYKLSWIPGKELILQQTKRTVKLYDMYQYFNKSLDAIAQDLFGESKDDMPEEWLLNMKEALANHPGKVVRYCVKDAWLAMKCAKWLQNRFNSIGLDFSRPLSCGTLSAKYFRITGNKLDTSHKVPYKINKLYDKCYFGGRFEILSRGTFENVVYADINSAYPAKIAKLHKISDCHGSWLSKTELKGHNSRRADLSYGCYKVKVKIESDYLSPVAQYMPDFPLVYFPAGSFTCWVDLHTYRLLEADGYLSELKAAHVFYTNSGELAFPQIDKLYRERKSNPDSSYALKIILNSLYGKLAQKDSRWREVKTLSGAIQWVNTKPCRRFDSFARFACLPYASHITGACRAQVYEAAKNTGALCIMTDCVIFPDINMSSSLESLPGGIGKELGQWSIERFNRVILIANGWYVYYHKDGRVTSHARGMRGKVDVPALLNDMGNRSTVHTTSKNRVSVKMASIRSDMRNKVNHLIDMPKTVNLNMDSKRYWQEKFRAVDFLRKQEISLPHVLVD